MRLTAKELNAGKLANHLQAMCLDESYFRLQKKVKIQNYQIPFYIYIHREPASAPRAVVPDSPHQEVVA